MKQNKKKPIKLKWLDRQAFFLPIYYTVASSQKILDAELKRMKFDGRLPGVNEDAGATTNFILNPEGETAAIVGLFEYKKYATEQVYSLLAHEAVHIFQAAMDHLGEKTPSSEFMAWTIQTIAQNLFYEFNRQTKGK